MSEPSPLLELLENAGLVHGSRIEERRVLRLSAGRLSDIGAQAAAVTRADSLNREVDTLSHTATISLGGGPEPCIGIDCRLEHINALVPFAALYSDRVYIHNFLSDHEHTEHAGYAPSLAERRFMLLADLQVIQHIRPLIESRLIVPVTAGGDVCHQCIVRGAFGTDADKRLVSERRRLARRFLEEMTVAVVYCDDGWELHCEAPQDLLEHGGQIIHLGEAPPAILDKPRVVKRALQGHLVPLSHDVRRKLRQHEAEASQVLDSVLFEMAVSQALGSSYLSDTKLPIEVLSAISGDPDLARRNSLVQTYLTSIVPFIGNVPVESVVRLRRREGDSFLAYRRALNRAIEDVRAQRADLTARDARSIYFDVLAPELARLDRAVRAARRDVLGTVGRSVAGWSAAITFGMYTGLVPTQLMPAAKALGLAKVLADLVGVAGRLISQEDSVRQEDLYFLWRVRRLSRRRG